MLLMALNSWVLKTFKYGDCTISLNNLLLRSWDHPHGQMFSSSYTVWTCQVLIYDCCPLFFYHAPMWRVWVHLLSNTPPPVWTQVLLLCHVKPCFISRLNKPRSFSFPSQGKWSFWLSLLNLFFFCDIFLVLSYPKLDAVVWCHLTSSE